MHFKHAAMSMTGLLDGTIRCIPVRLVSHATEVRIGLMLSL
jgi:hypothetical protein